MWLKQSTAVTIKLGPFVDSTDGVTAETGLTISQADIKLTKNGGTIAQSNNAAGATHDANGYYGVPLDTTDTNTLGTLRVMISESGALPVWQDFMVVPANVWDSMFGSDLLDVSLVQVAGSTTNVAALATNVDAILTDTGTTLQGELDGIQADTEDIQSRLPAALTADGNIKADTLRIGGTLQTANDVGADVDAILVDTGTTLDGKIDTIDTVVDSILVDTAEIGAAGAGLTVLATQSSVNAIDDYVDTEIAAIKAKTDQLTFTTANKVDARTFVNDDKTGYSLAAGQLFVKKNTALAAFMFVMTDDTNHVPTTGLTVTATRSIDGAAFGACANSPSEVASGVYKIDLAAADLNGTNIMLRFTATGADDILVSITTQA